MQCTFFQHSKEGIYKKLGEMIDGMPKVTHSPLAPKMVYRDGHWAYMTDMTQLQYIVNKECAKFVVGDEVFFLAGLGFIMPKNSVYKDMINKQ